MCGLRSQGASPGQPIKQLVHSRPTLTREGVPAALEYAAEAMLLDVSLAFQAEKNVVRVERVDSVGKVAMIAAGQPDLQSGSCWSCRAGSPTARRRETLPPSLTYRALRWCYTVWVKYS